MKTLVHSKWYRRLLAGVLSLSLLTTLLPLTALGAEERPILPAESAMEAQQPDVLPEVLAAGDVKTWDIGPEGSETKVTATLSEGTLTIQGTGPMKNWTTWTEVPWDDYSGGIKTLKLDGTVTTISDYAFADCFNLQSVIIPEGVTSIGAYAFQSCSNELKTIQIPESMTTIGMGAFSGCSALTSITIPNAVKTLGPNAFWYCENLTSVDLGSGLTKISGATFDLCINLPSVTIPENITYISQDAFQRCSKLQTVTMRFDVANIKKHIEMDAFEETPADATFQVSADESASDVNFLSWSSTKDDPEPIFSTPGASSSTLKGAPSALTITAKYDLQAEWTPTGGQPARGTFEAAWTALAATGGSMKLVSPVTTLGLPDLTADVSLDLNGQTWTSSVTNVPSGVTLTVTDSAEDGKITRPCITGTSTVTVEAGGTFDLQGGKIECTSAGNAIKNAGTLKISGEAAVSAPEAAINHLGALYLSGEPKMNSGSGYQNIACGAGATVCANNGKSGSELAYCYNFNPISIAVPQGAKLGDIVVSGLEDAMQAKRFTVSNVPGELVAAYDAGTKTIQLAPPVESYGIYVGKTLINANNKDDVLQDGTVSYNSETFTLTLNGATIQDEDRFEGEGKSYGIYSTINNPLQLVLKGQNEINIKTGSVGYGVYHQNALTISGDGALKITTGQSQRSCGIYSSSDFTFASGSVDITTGDATGDAYGVLSINVSIQSGALKIATGKSEYSCGISCTFNFVSENAAIEITTGEGSQKTDGIYGGNLTVNSGTLKIKTGEAVTGCGMYAAVSIRIADGVVNTTAGKTTAEPGKGGSLGMYCYKKGDTAIQITGGTVTAATMGGAEGTAQAIAPGPNFSDYARGVAVASTSGDGSSTVTYSADDNDSYQYVKIYKKPNRPAGSPSPKPTVTPSPTSTPSATPTPGPTEAPSKGETTVTAPVDQDGNASVLVSEENVAEAIAQAQENATPGQPIVVSIQVETDKVPTQLSAVLPKTVQDALLNNQVDSITIASETVTIGFNKTALQTMNGQAQGEITITAAKMDTGELTGEAKELIGNRPLVDFKAVYGKGETITEFGGDAVAISIPYPLGEGENPEDLEAVYVDEEGKATLMEHSSYDPIEQTLDFKTSHFSGYGVGYRKSTPVFNDIENHWAKADIEFVAEKGLLLGMGEQTFAPNTPMTRGMFVTALGRLAGIDPADFTSGKFTDVKEGAYYAPYVHWAAEKGIVNGTGEFTFSPNQGISRQEMAVIIINYATAYEYTIPATLDPITFADQDAIGTWAAEAVKEMQMAGVMNGRNDLTFDPIGTATRAEVATVLHRYIQLVIESNP